MLFFSSSTNIYQIPSGQYHQFLPAGDYLSITSPLPHRYATIVYLQDLPTDNSAK